MDARNDPQGDADILTFDRCERIGRIALSGKAPGPEGNVLTDDDLGRLIVQGRYDIVCPMLSAWELHQAWPEAEFIVVPDAGHAVTEPGIQTALLDATDRFAKERGS